MILLHYQLTPELANCYLVVDEATSEALLVDAGEFCRPLAEDLEANHWRLTKVFITHSHYDHNGAVEEYAARYAPEKLYGASELCAGKHTNLVCDGEEISLGRLRGEVLQVPGHTPDLSCLYFAEQGIVFTGDSLFAGSVGGTSSEANRRQQLEQIHSKLLSLPDEVRVLSGHGPATTIYIERHYNPFLQGGM